MSQYRVLDIIEGRYFHTYQYSEKLAKGYVNFLNFIERCERYEFIGQENETI